MSLVPDNTSLKSPGKLGETAAKSPEDGSYNEHDVFGPEEGHDIRFKTIGWQSLGWLLIAAALGSNIYCIPLSLAVVGIIPGLIFHIFFGVLGLFTGIMLVKFKLNHPEVHTMGDAGFILFGSVGREIFVIGSIIFAISGTGIGILQALSLLSNNAICTTYFGVILSVLILVAALPRKLDSVSWLAYAAVATISISSVVAMIGAGINPEPGRKVQVVASNDFYTAFLAIANAVFCNTAHVLFFTFVSEMDRPQDAVKGVCLLQGFMTTCNVIFGIVLYVFIGSTVQNPAPFSLPPVWAKISLGIGLPSFIISAILNNHFATKLVFVRIFRHSRHLYSNSLVGWTTWVGLNIIAVIVAFVFAVAVPIFSYIGGITASLFGSWYTYAIPAMLWGYDSYQRGGYTEMMHRRTTAAIAALALVVGAFVCVAGTYVFIKLIADAYRDGTVGTPFAC